MSKSNAPRLRKPWVPVGVALPPNPKPVIAEFALRSGGGQNILRYSADGWRDLRGRPADRPVTYWRPFDTGPSQ